jgi:hypothetical protein
MELFPLLLAVFLQRFVGKQIGLGGEAVTLQERHEPLLAGSLVMMLVEPRASLHHLR